MRGISTESMDGTSLDLAGNVKAIPLDATSSQYLVNLSIKNTGDKTFESNIAVGVFGPAGDIYKTAGDIRTKDMVLEPGQVGYVEFLSGEGTQSMLLNCSDGIPLFSVFILQEDRGDLQVRAMSVSELPDLRAGFGLGDEQALFLPTVYPTGEISVNV